LPYGGSCGLVTLWIERAGTFLAVLEFDTVLLTCERRVLDHGLLFIVFLLVYVVSHVLLNKFSRASSVTI